MSKEKQILQMLQDGYSQRRIASTLRISRNTVAKVVNAASDHQLPKGALDSMWIYQCAESACPVFWKSPVRKEEIMVSDR